MRSTTPRISSNGDDLDFGNVLRASAGIGYLDVSLSVINCYNFPSVLLYSKVTTPFFWQPVFFRLSIHFSVLVLRGNL